MVLNSLQPMIAWTASDSLTVLNLCLTAIYCVLTAFIWKAAQKQIEASRRPYLFFGLEFKSTLVEAVLKNTGKSPALDVSVSMTPGIRRKVGDPGSPSVLLSTKGFTIPAESESREYLGSWQDVGAEARELVYEVTICYKGVDGKQYNETMKLSFEHHRDRAHISRKSADESLADIAESLGKIASKRD